MAVDHRVCFRSLHEFQRQSQVAAAAAAAAVAGFSAFNLHSSAVGADQRYYLPQGPLSKSTEHSSLACYCVSGDDVGQVGGVARCSPADAAAVPARYLQVTPGNSEDSVVLRRTFP